MNDEKNQEVISISDEFGSRVRHLRKKLGMVQEEFGESLGVSLATVNRLERGHFKPSAEFLAKLAVTYQCDIGWLLTGQELGRDSSVSSDTDLVRDPYMCDQIKAQREGLQEIIDRAKDDGELESQSIKRLRAKVDYLDALLEVGHDPRA